MSVAKNNVPRVTLRNTFKSPKALFDPPNVAIVGATDRPGWPSTIRKALADAEYRGNVYPVNPKYDKIWGEKCYRTLEDIPERVAHALIIVPAHAVTDTLTAGIANGLKSATVYSSSIGDGADPASIERGHALKHLIADTNIIVNGPNCMGINNLHSRFLSYPRSSFVTLLVGSVSCVFQSGGTLQFLVDTAAKRGVRFSKFASSGNEIDLDLADYVDYLVDDPETSVICLFIEGIRRPAMFMAAAARALAASKPIIAIKTGKSLKSREAAASHTGAIAGDYLVFQAMCERYGIVLCSTLDDMVEALLAFQAGRHASGANVGWITTSGGTVDLLYDYIEEDGRTLAPVFPDSCAAELRPHIPGDIAVKNPLDAGLPTKSQSYVDMCRAVSAADNIDMVAWASVLPEEGFDAEAASALSQIIRNTDKPVIGFSRIQYNVSETMVGAQERIGIPHLQGLPQVVRTLAALAFYGKRKGTALEALSLHGGHRPIDDFGSVLPSYNVPLPESRLIKTMSEAAAAARDIGYPVALKAISPQHSHKTEINAVHIGIENEHELHRHAEDLFQIFSAPGNSATLEGLLVQSMVKGVEAIIGIRNDELYGPVMIIGSGGTKVELLQDTALVMLPIDRSDVESAITRLKLSHLLDGWRGAPRADIAAFIDAVFGLSRFFIDHGANIREIEINPLIVMAEGYGVAAVDIRVVKQ